MWAPLDVLLPLSLTIPIAAFVAFFLNRAPLEPAVIRRMKLRAFCAIALIFVLSAAAGYAEYRLDQSVWHARFFGRIGNSFPIAALDVAIFVSLMQLRELPPIVTAAGVQDDAPGMGTAILIGCGSVFLSYFAIQERGAARGCFGDQLWILLFPALGALAVESQCHLFRMCIAAIPYDPEQLMRVRAAQILGWVGLSSALALSLAGL